MVGIRCGRAAIGGAQDWYGEEGAFGGEAGAGLDHDFGEAIQLNETIFLKLKDVVFDFLG